MLIRANNLPPDVIKSIGMWWQCSISLCLSLVCFGILGDSVPVVRGSALAALEGIDEEPIHKLMQALDELPAPERHEVVIFLSQ